MSPRGAGAPAVTIRHVLREFLEKRKQELSPAEFRLYRHVVFFLELCINNYGHRNLDEAERARYERLYYRPGEAGCHFFEVFGAERLLPELDFFTRSYLPGEVHTSERVAERASEVVSSLKEWLVESGNVSSSDLEREEERARARARLRLRLRRLVRQMSRRLVSVAPEVLAEEDYVRPDDHFITRVEPGRIWLRVFRSASSDELGPFLVPLTASRTLRAGWTLDCALGRLAGRWQIIELLEIYPRTAASLSEPGARRRPRRARMTLP